MTLPPIVVDELGVWIVLLVVVGSEDDIVVLLGVGLPYTAGITCM